MGKDNIPDEVVKHLRLLEGSYFFQVLSISLNLDKNNSVGIDRPLYQDMSALQILAEFIPADKYWSDSTGQVEFDDIIEHTCLMIDKLIEHGADINRLDSEDKNPLFNALISNNTKIICKLVQLGANTLQVNVFGESALEVATRLYKLSSISEEAYRCITNEL